MTTAFPTSSASVISNISRREQFEAEGIASVLPDALRRRNLKPVFSGYFLARVANMTVLITPLDTTQIGNQAPYVSDGLLHQLSTEFGERLKRRVPVYKSNTSGIRYVIVLSPLPRMPEKVDLPSGVQRGQVALGLSYTGGNLVTTWDRTHHWAVMGMTGSGKSGFLRLLAYSALQDEARLLISDMDQTTFPMLANHPALLAPIATTGVAVLDMLRQALAECDHRAALYQAMPGYPEKLAEYNALAVKHSQEPLPRVVIFLDEFSSVMQSNGRSTGEAGQVLSTLGWRGRKFGVHVVFAGQDFAKDLVGPVREQAALSVCFRIKPGQRQVAENLGCRGAQNIPAERPGLAISDRFGPFQTFFMPKELLISGTSPAGIALEEIEQMVFTRALQENEGRLPLSKIIEWAGAGVGPSRARTLQEDWGRRGWIAKDPQQDNSFSLTERGKTLIRDEKPTNQQTQQTPANRDKPDDKPGPTTSKLA
jgi:predicted transcriptional regulator